jgi:hypothetical protein
MGGEHLGLGRRQEAVEPAQHRQRENDLAVFVAFVRAAKQAADAPNEVGELGMGLGEHSDRNEFCIFGDGVERELQVGLKPDLHSA